MKMKNKLAEKFIDLIKEQVKRDDLRREYLKKHPHRKLKHMWMKTPQGMIDIKSLDLKPGEVIEYN